MHKPVKLITVVWFPNSYTVDALQLGNQTMITAQFTIDLSSAIDWFLDYIIRIIEYSVEEQSSASVIAIYRSNLGQYTGLYNLYRLRV